MSLGKCFSVASLPQATSTSRPIRAQPVTTASTLPQRAKRSPRLNLPEAIDLLSTTVSPPVSLHSCHDGGGLQTASAAAPNPLDPAPPTPEPPPHHHARLHPTPTPPFHNHTPLRPKLILPLQSRLELLPLGQPRQRRRANDLLRQPHLSPRQHGDPVRAAADSMDCRADGQVPSDPGAGVGVVDSVLGSDCVCEELEGVGD